MNFSRKNIHINYPHIMHKNKALTHFNLTHWHIYFFHTNMYIFSIYCKITYYHIVQSWVVHKANGMYQTNKRNSFYQDDDTLDHSSLVRDQHFLVAYCKSASLYIEELYLVSYLNLPHRRLLVLENSTCQVIEFACA